MREGGPAFPRSGFAPDGVGSEDCTITDAQEGMTLREWYAGRALGGLLAAHTGANSWETPKDMADLAVSYADALLARLEAS